MADYEVSKIMWVAIVVALASSIFVIAKPEISKQSKAVFDKVGQVVDSSGSDKQNTDPDKPETPDDNQTEEPVVPEEVVGANLLGADYIGTDLTGWTLTTNAWKVTPDASGNILTGTPDKSPYQQLASMDKMIQVKAGEALTVSFDMRDKGYSSDYIALVVRVFASNKLEDFKGYNPDTGKLTSGTWNASGQSIYAQNVTRKDLNADKALNDWTRVSYTFTPDKSGWLSVMPYVGDTTGNLTVDFRNFKLEAGDKATAFEK